MPKHVYGAFLLKHVTNKRCKCGSGRAGERSYATFECPHCQCEIDIPAEAIRNQKAPACKAHLAKCSVYNGKKPFKRASPPPTESPAPKQPKPATTDAHTAMVTIYALVLVPENRLVYTGRTKDPDRRLAQHAHRSSQCRLVRNAFKKHGRKNFHLKVLMRCRAADAKANETAWIVRNNTVYPNGCNLMHGPTAGEDSDPHEQIVPTFAGVVPFEGDEEELEATGEAWIDVADVVREGNIAEEEHNNREMAQKDVAKNAVDATCRALLKETHPDRAGSDRTFTSTEVAALVNSVRANLA